ncbi:MAG TPA: pyridoxamine 5'-phosphate oxidase [Thermoanaerobaculia bacterium]|nr:pyridoxamine 5'-phosphate oxidase [Thermoanaerobaculia bacterium]
MTDPETPAAAGDAPPPPHAEGREAPDPIAAFQEAFSRAQKREPVEASAVVLATATPDGRPSARTVLLRGVDERGFVFFTNYGSRKARELEENPRAALCVYWESIEQQVRIEGPVERVSADESDAYFAGRPRMSQIGAWASRQSEPLDSRARLLGRAAQAEARFLGRPVPRPPFWGGYRLVPDRIEFWWNQLHRLHDRVAYTRDGDGWKVERLYP